LLDSRIRILLFSPPPEAKEGLGARLLVDLPFGIDVRPLAVRLVVVEHVLGGFVERDQADLGIDWDAALDVT
jgi:hypothetical protein